MASHYLNSDIIINTNSEIINVGALPKIKTSIQPTRSSDQNKQDDAGKR